MSDADAVDLERFVAAQGRAMTLFALAAGDGESLFQQALCHFWDNRMDGRTLALLGAASHSRGTPAAGL